ncbi:conjugative transposon protein TraN [Sphingobacterium kitahiroshimense]|uniref:Conjugative transposon protein TraN n=1 Tax=Sphingobacterium kitahiroshimense TaxID=470446 RepID=A0ABV0BQI4_9SPHI
MNKILFVSLFLLFTGIGLHAQEKASTYRDELPVILMDSSTSLHIISPEPIRYVDISTHAVVGDLPETNVLRLKLVPDSVQGELTTDAGSLGIVTVIGESYIAQYRLRCFQGTAESSIVASFNILPSHTRPLDSPIDPTTPQLRRHALSMLAQRKVTPVRKAENYGIRAELGGVYTVGDLVLLDITYRNTTNLSYDIDEMRFKIEDRKITKATNVQSIEIKPIWQLYPNALFKKNYRNIYVLKKTTFPANKVLNVELSEKQISGRTITLKIRYKDILNADTF